MSTDPAFGRPLPAHDTPVIAAHRIVTASSAPPARFADPVWPLAALSANPSADHVAINWRRCPAEFQLELRRAAWNMINGELPHSIPTRRGPTLRTRLGPAETRKSASAWMALAAWLRERDVTTLADCDAPLLDQYARHLRESGAGRDQVRKTLTAIRRLWAYDQLSAQPAGVARPPWDASSVEAYLPPAAGHGGENLTEPLAETTIAPLLVWATRVVEQFSGDILAGWAETQRITRAARTPARERQAGLEQLMRLLAPQLAGQAPVPAAPHRDRFGLARTYLAGMTGATAAQIRTLDRRHGLAALAAQHPGPCPLPIPVNARINARPWKSALDFHETGTLIKHLGTAAFVVISYLTGMRPGEVLGLRAGCCPEPARGAHAPGWSLIRGTQFKTALDHEGNHDSRGTPRQAPWVAIAPVVAAIRVLERIVGDGQLLFDHQAHFPRGNPRGRGSIKAKTMSERIEDFASWANTLAREHGLEHELIAPGPAGPIGTARFRRTLAWHIARRPNGLVALAVQYGHLGTALTAGGYASRARGGIHDLIDIETARAVADTVAELRGQIEAGAGVSGPAARRVITTAASAPRFEGTATTTRAARHLLANPNETIFDNPQAIALCHYKPERALCHRDRPRPSPSLERCESGCGNIARTDAHAGALRERAELFETRAGAVPAPLGERLRANAARLREIADTHDHTKIHTLEPTA